MNKSNDLKMRVKYYEHYKGDMREWWADGFAVQYYDPDTGSEDDERAWGLGTFFQCKPYNEESIEAEMINYKILKDIARAINLGYEVRILDSLPVKYK